MPVQLDETLSCSVDEFHGVTEYPRDLTPEQGAAYCLRYIGQAWWRQSRGMNPERYTDMVMMVDVKELPDSDHGTLRPSCVREIRDLVMRKDLGHLTLCPWAHNHNSGNKCRVVVWRVNWPNFKAWLNTQSEYPPRDRF